MKVVNKLIDSFKSGATMDIINPLLQDALSSSETSEDDLNLQVAYPVESEDLEVMLFNHRLHNELSVEIGIALPEDMEEIKSTFKKKYRPIQLRTVSSPFPFLVMLAHLHYKTDWFPDYINLGFLEIQK